MPLSSEHDTTILTPVPQQRGRRPGRLLPTCLLVMSAMGILGGAVAHAGEQDNASEPELAAPQTETVTGGVVTRPKDKPPVVNSGMDATLFYQLLIAEIKANSTDAGTAYQIYLEVAKRHQSNQLYQRAVEIALRARAGEQALNAAKAWRQALPQSREASEFTAQILLALQRANELASPLRSLIQLTPAPQQPQVIASLPRTVARLNDKKAAAEVVDEATEPWRQPPLELAEAWAASAEAWMNAPDSARALASLDKALALKPNHAGAGLVAIELMSSRHEAEERLKTMLARPDAPSLVRLAYARKLATSQRYEDSAQQLETLLKAQPDQTGSWLTLAAVRLELKQLDKAEAALKRVLALQEGKDKAPANDASTRIGSEVGDVEQAYLLMAQVADMRNQPGQAAEWLQRADPKGEKLNIQAQRARLLMKQGKTAEARKLIRALPETEPRDAVTKYQAEAQLLRDAQQWDEAYKVLSDATRRFPEDTDLLYDLAMLGEKLKKFAEMERLLRKVMELNPENPNAFNALGYSYADRGVKLDEARVLIQKALVMKPQDPFITDSLGWLEFRAGNAEEAARILKEALQSRADPEIAAHYGEVLWSLGQKEEAARVWREAFKGNADNDTLKDTMKRFHVAP
ncbi:MAG: tetratricopeptide repeat protein [Aquabacterium sp.]